MCPGDLQIVVSGFKCTTEGLSEEARQCVLKASSKFISSYKGESKVYCRFISENSIGKERLEDIAEARTTFRNFYSQAMNIHSFQIQELGKRFMASVAVLADASDR